MKLLKVTIEDYKSIKKIEWDLNEPLTCLVGQNESGKSNLLEIFNYIKKENYKNLNYEIHTNRSSKRYLNNEISNIAFYYLPNRREWAKTFSMFNGEQTFQNFIRLTYPNYPTDFSYSNIQFKMQIEDQNNSLYICIGNQEFKINDLFIAESSYEEYYENVFKSTTNIILIKEELDLSFKTSIDSIRSGQVSESSIVKLLNISGLKNPEQIPLKNTSLNQYLRELNKNLNNNFVKKYYTQDKSVTFKFVHDSGEIYLEIEDHTQSSYLIEERSEGFKYYFSLLIEMADAANNTDEIIFILDEPGLRLHPSGQRDLLNYLEDLSKRYRIIYTTHSPFLINRLYPNRVKIVERDSINGTCFKNKGFSKNWKPMRSALGLNIKDSFYYSDKALIVEGPEDMIFISGLINYFNNQNIVKLNTDIFAFIDAGGEGNLPAMVQIIIDNERPTLVLVDSDVIGTYNRLNKKVMEVNDSKILDLIQISDFNKFAKSIEDLLPVEILEQAVINYCNELLKDEVLKFRSEKKRLVLNLNEIRESRYKFISDKVKELYLEDDIVEVDWDKKKVPISKVGIARHFEILLNDEKFKKTEINFDDSKRLVKTIAEKLNLLET